MTTIELTGTKEKALNFMNGELTQAVNAEAANLAGRVIRRIDMARTGTVASDAPTTQRELMADLVFGRYFEQVRNGGTFATVLGTGSDFGTFAQVLTDTVVDALSGTLDEDDYDKVFFLARLSIHTITDHHMKRAKKVRMAGGKLDAQPLEHLIACIYIEFAQHLALFGFKAKCASF